MSMKELEEQLGGLNTQIQETQDTIDQRVKEIKIKKQEAHQRAQLQQGIVTAQRTLNGLKDKEAELDKELENVNSEVRPEPDTKEHHD